MNCIKNEGGFQMNPLDHKKKLREEFNRNKNKRNIQRKEIVSFSEFGIKVDTNLLKKYREERGGVTY